MEKQEVIKVLREKLALWEQIIPLMTKATNLAIQKGQAIDDREKESKKHYTSNPDIKIKKELPTDHAQNVQDSIDYRHREECTKAAQKKFKLLHTLLTVILVIAM